MAGKMAVDAASMVGEAALNGVFQGLSQALTPIIQQKLGQLWGVDKELKRLKRHLSEVKPLLNDAETRQFTEDSVRSWVSDLRGLTYDMEDIVDEMNCELLRSQMEGRNKSDGEQVLTLFSYLKLDKVRGAVENFSFNYQIASKINEVLEKWEEIVQDGKALNLREGVGGRTLGDVRKSRETTSFVDKDGVFGRESDKEQIISFLKSDESRGRGNLSVIGIVGMGGLGKTTLAKLAYNETPFDLKAWVHVSHEFDRVSVIRCIIEALTDAKYKLPSLDRMQCRLQELVKDKKLLLVLDDAWTENSEDWEILLAPLIRSVQKGSKIIATTRSEEVCRSMGLRDCVYRLKGLSDSDCWTIVKEKAFGYGGTAEEQANLERVRVKVVEKCQGLPLAANVLGGLLGTVPVDKWERLLKSKIWELPKTKYYIFPTLMLSYLSLDPHLKRCFTYAATCYKDNIFYKKDMIRLWMAEGFIEVNKSEQMEDIANDYFDDLVARHFFQFSGFSHYVMHDLIRELAEVIMGNISLSIQGEIGTKTPTEETRHISLRRTLEAMDEVAKAKNLRTFSAEISSDEILKQIVLNFERLRVLDLSTTSSIQKIPKSIGNLKHLRYFGLQMSRIKSLPDSIHNLYNLQILNLSECEFLVELSENIGNLINLRYLNLYWTGLQMLPDSLCELEKLEEINLTMCKEFVVLPTNIGNLKNLRILGLSHTRLQMLPDSLCELEKLEEIHLSGCDEFVVLPTNIGNLKNLRNLNLFKTRLQMLPDSLCELEELETIDLSGCKEFVGLPTNIGNLKNLRWIDLSKTRLQMLPDSLCELEKLKEIYLSKCKEFVELPTNIGNLKNLRSLYLSNTILQMLPDSLYELEKLEEIDLSLCKEFVVLPTNIGNLKNLRRLNLSNTRLQMLPDSLCELEKLEVIDLSGCKEFVVLPTNIGNLKNLERLNLRGSSVEKLPDSICRLHNLRSLRLSDSCKLLELPKEMSNIITFQ